MPFYTFKCPNCNVEKEILQSMKSANPKCDDCGECGCNRADKTCGCGGKMKKFQMERIYKPNAKPGSKDGSWGFGKGGSG